ncbi:MAG: Nif3-like dinuclear metal center hexameric protein [Vallitaleaceae bacterium]|nr:Nif3-like dinuclear metal center hexameric protein [Vallitaleaceae bacterium]
MSIYVKDVMRVMEQFAPLSLAQDWDNCGLVVGDEVHTVKKIYLAIDPTKEVIQAAIATGADMIVTHHPLMIHKINQVNASTVVGQKIIQLIHNNVALYCAHTNLDQAIGGLNDFLAEKLGFSAFEVLEITGTDNEGNNVGFGRVGFLKKPIQLEILAQKIKETLGLNYIHLVGDRHRWVQKVAIGSGSGMDALSHAIACDADVFITGDVKYHGAIEAKELGISLIDATHFGTENIVSELLSQIFKNELPEVELIIDQHSLNPIDIL